MVITSLQRPHAKNAFSEAGSPIAFVALQGEYNLARREELVATLEAIPMCDIAIIDMREVTHIDATAVTSFVKLRKRLCQTRPAIVRIVGLQHSLYRFREVANLNQIFEAFDTIVDAMGEYGYTRQPANGYTVRFLKEALA